MSLYSDMFRISNNKQDGQQKTRSPQNPRILPMQPIPGCCLLWRGSTKTATLPLAMQYLPLLAAPCVAMALDTELPCSASGEEYDYFCSGKLVLFDLVVGQFSGRLASCFVECSHHKWKTYE